MFFNRSLQMRMVRNAKKADSNDTETPEADFEGRAIIIAHSVGKGIWTICLALCAYVALDTLRQVAVEHAKHPK